MNFFRRRLTWALMAILLCAAILIAAGVADYIHRNSIHNTNAVVRSWSSRASLPVGLTIVAALITWLILDLRTVKVEWRRTYDPEAKRNRRPKAKRYYKDRASVRGAIRWAVVLFLIVLTLFFAIGFIPWLTMGDNAATFGDSFGFANALFSGLAFVGVIVAIVLQTVELRYQRQEINESQAISERTAKANERVMKYQLQAVYIETMAALPGFDEICSSLDLEHEFIMKAKIIDQLEFELHGGIATKSLLLQLLEQAIDVMNLTRKHIRDEDKFNGPFASNEIVAKDINNKATRAGLIVAKDTLTELIGSFQDRSLSIHIAWLVHRIDRFLDTTTLDLANQIERVSSLLFNRISQLGGIMKEYEAANPSSSNKEAKP